MPLQVLTATLDETTGDAAARQLKNELDKIKGTYDYVLIDNPPALGWLTLNSFTASDRVLVVVSPGTLSWTV